MNGSPIQSSLESHRESRFSYELISAQFIKRLIELLTARHSVVVLGPRGIGKQVILSRVREAVAKLPGAVVIRLRCDDARLAQPRRLRDEMVKQLCEADGSISLENLCSEAEDCLEHLGTDLQTWLENRPCRLIVLASNLDYLPDRVSRSLLKVVRKLTQLDGTRGSCTVLLTGASDLAPLVHGEGSEFAVSDQFVLSGFDQEVFQQEVKRFINTVGLTAEPQAFEGLQERSGGNSLLLRVVFDTLIERRRGAEILPTVPISQIEIEGAINDIENNLAVFRDVCVRSFARLEADFTALRHLRDLILSDEAALPAEKSNTDQYPWPRPQKCPTEVELAGVARRESSKLIWASPLMKALACSYFDLRSLGDGFGRCHQWEQHATWCYELALKRDGGIGHATALRPRWQSALRAFGANLFRIAAQSETPANAIKNFFAMLGPYLLDFDEVRFVSEQPRCVDSRSSEAVYEFAHSLDHIDGTAGWVVLSNCSTKNAVTRDHMLRAKEPLESLAQSLQLAHNREELKTKFDYQEKTLAAIPVLIESIAGVPERVLLALGEAGDRLRNNGYRRVMFSMVNRVANLIEGVLDCSDTADIFNVAHKTKYPLDVPYDVHGKPQYQDIQQIVVIERRTQAVADARKEYASRLVNPEVLSMVDLRGFAVIALIKNGRVIATMHVERNDQQPIAEDELKRLEDFANHLAGIIHAVGTVDLLEGAVHEEVEAVFLLDCENHVCFINKAGCKFVNSASSSASKLDPGWQRIEARPLVASLLGPQIADLVILARERQSAVSRDILIKGNDGHSHLQHVYASPLFDWRGVLHGVLIQIRDLDRTQLVLQTLKKLGGARTEDELADVFLEFCRHQGHRWVRIYRFGEDPSRLVGWRHLEPELSNFDFTTIRLPDRSKPGSTWICLDYKDKILLRSISGQSGEESGTETSQLDNFGKAQSGGIFTTTHGLTAKQVLDPHCPEPIKKKFGDMWYDFPLPASDGQRMLGKISLDWDDSKSMDDLNCIEIVIAAMQSELANFNDRELQKFVEEGKRTKSTLEALGLTAHHLKSHVTSMGLISQRYQFARTAEQTEALNEEFASYLGNMSQVLREMTHCLSPMKCQRAEGDLVACIKAEFNTKLRPETLKFESNAPRIDASFDGNLLRQAIAQLIENAAKAIGDRAKLRMQATVEIFNRFGLPWCRIVIGDNGPGIPEQNRSRVFEEFFSEWPEGTERGNGLGLYFVRNVVHMHGGNIVAETSELGGAQFRLEFPRDKPAESPAPTLNQTIRDLLEGGQQP